MKFLAIAVLSALFLSPPASDDYYLLVGTYDSPKSEGIYVYHFNTTEGTAKAISHVKSSNASFLAVAPGNRYVYAVNESGDKNGKGGKVSSFVFNKKNGTLDFVNSQPSEGNHPCHIITDKKGKWAIVSNYSSGTLAILPIDKNGKLQPAVTVLQDTGSGTHPARQQSPHVHSSLLNNDDKLWYADLGTDKIMTYLFDKKTGSVRSSKLKYTETPAGSGPRHMDMAGDLLYVVGELTGTVSVYKDHGSADLHLIQTISTLPGDYKGFAGSADIHISPDGRFLYVSNRGESNTIGIFSIDKKTGLLTTIGHQSSLGKGPRNFSIDPSGNFLLAANQQSDEIVIFNRDKETGLLADSGKRIAIGKPVCIKWIPAR